MRNPNLPSDGKNSSKGAGTGYDHVHFWVWKTLEQGAKAQTKVCYNSEEFNRQPLITLTYLNPEETWSFDSDIQRKSDIYLLMHVLAYALGFNYDDMPYWLKTEAQRCGSAAFSLFFIREGKTMLTEKHHKSKNG